MVEEVAAFGRDLRGQALVLAIASKRLCGPMHRLQGSVDGAVLALQAVAGGAFCEAMM
jgi:hypothetical protein